MISTSTHEILMIRPARFGYNPETAASNSFQKKDELEDTNVISNLAIAEFDNMVHLLRNNGVTVHVIEDTVSPTKPDALFPNNWISFHSNGQIITYPMLALSRQHEIRNDILQLALREWSYKSVLRLDARAKKGAFLEGTGSMILDRPNKIVYACISPRTNYELLQEWADIHGYKTVTFKALDGGQKEIYHTNVIMALGDEYAIICLDCIPDLSQRTHLSDVLESSGKKIIPISLDQVNHFAGNMLQVLNNRGERLLVLSEQAFQSLQSDQIELLTSYARLLPIPLWTIEKYGGGSARCMMAEIFKPS